MAGGGAGDAVEGFEGLLYVHFAVGAHHSFDLSGLGHFTFLLENVLYFFHSPGEGFRVHRILLPVAGGIRKAQQVQPERVGYHKEAGQAHGSGPEHGAQFPAEQGIIEPRRQRDADHVVEKGPEEVLVDVAQHRPAQADRRGHVGQAALHQHHVRRVDGDVRTGPDGDAGIGPGQGRGVVDAVAHHRQAAQLLEPAHHRFLAVRQDARDHRVHPGLSADGLRRALVVPRQHDDADAQLSELLDCLRALLPKDVRHGDQAQQRPVPREEQGGLSFLRQLRGLPPDLFRHRQGPFQIPKAPTDQRPALAVPSGQAVARQGGKAGHFQGADLLFFRAGGDGLGQRMLGERLQRHRCG